MISRRRVIKGLAGVGVAGAVAGAVRWGLLAPPPHQTIGDARTLLRSVFEQLSDGARASALVPYDHPLRQYHNRGLWIAGATVAPGALSWGARRDLTDLVVASLSPAGRQRILHQDAISVSGVNFAKLLFCGDPRSGPCQAVLSTGHLNLRLGGGPMEGIAFGGPQVYGDQRGDEKAGLPGNTYRYQFELARQLIAAMTPAERKAVRVERAPAQVNVGVQGAAGHFDGLAIGELPAARRAMARNLVDGILGTYAEADAAYAAQCIERNGGVDALRFADYNTDYDTSWQVGDEPSQIFRLEGPAAVMHFRGAPHVHAFINIAMDGERPLSVGEKVCELPVTLEGETLRVAFEEAMREKAQADVAIQPLGSVVGRLRAGTVRTGDVWVAESWNNGLAVVEARGDDLEPALRAALEQRGVTVQGDRSYRIAANEYVARDGVSRDIKRVQARQSLGPLRDALAEYLHKRYG
jgi:hypothetical protein